MSDETFTTRSETDWERIRAMRDEDIDLSELPEATSTEMARGVLRFEGRPIPEGAVLVPVERELVDRFKARAGSAGCSALINAALRAAISS